MSAGPAALRQALAATVPDGWIVGGAVRDRLLGRSTLDLDVVVPGSPEVAARELGRRARGHAFQLSAEFGGWRVVARAGGWQVDVLPLAGTIEADLGARDLTVNAMAETIDGGRLIDPFGGERDLRDHVLRAVSPSAFERDPLRPLRMVRLVAELGFTIEEGSCRLARASAVRLASVSPERVFAELRRLLVSERALAGLALMERLELMDAVLPEIVELKGVEQSRYHHLDVHDHTMAVLAETIRLTREPDRLLDDPGDLSSVFQQPLGDELTRGQALRLGALLHDVAKPRTRGELGDGRVTFIGHETVGAEMVGAILRRLRASERLVEYVAALVRHHLRLGFLVHETPLDRRQLYRYLQACDPVEVEVTVLSVADRLATRGHRSPEAIERHLDLAREVLPSAVAWRREPPRSPLRGDELVRAAGLRPGPQLGRVLAALREAAYAGEIATREEALALAGRLMGQGEPP